MYIALLCDVNDFRRRVLQTPERIRSLAKAYYCNIRLLKEGQHTLKCGEQRRACVTRINQRLAHQIPAQPFLSIKEHILL